MVKWFLILVNTMLGLEKLRALFLECIDVILDMNQGNGIFVTPMEHNCYMKK